MMDAAAFAQHCAAERSGAALYLPGWTEADWQALFLHLQPLMLARGERLMKRGESERALYFVADGALAVDAGSDRGGALGTMVRERPGAVIGEIGFFDGWPRTATVWAIETTQLLRLDFNGWGRFAAAQPALGHELLIALGRILAFRIRRNEERRAGGLL